MSKSLRETAEAVLAKWDEDGFVGLNVIDNLRDALSEPDPLTEAVELIEPLHGFSCARLCGTERHHEWCVTVPATSWPG